MRCTQLVLVLVFLFAVVTVTPGCGGGGSPAATSAVPGDGSGSNSPGGGGVSAETASLSWNSPVSNTNGTALTDLRGYKIYYGTSPGSYTAIVDVGKVTSFSLQNLSPGTYYITVSAYNSAGTESGYSNEVSKKIL